MFERIKAALGIVTKGAGEHLAGLGVSKADWKKTTGNVPYMAADRSTVRRTLDAVIHGATDFVGLPRISVPAEYVAACIHMVVSPVNWQVACRWAEQGRTMQDLAVNPDTGAAPMSAEQLFACVQMLEGEETVAVMRAQFEKRVGMAVAFSEANGEPAEAV